MSKLYEVIHKLTNEKVMVNFKSFPSHDNCHLMIQTFGSNEKQYLYSGSIEQIEKEVLRDFPLGISLSLPKPPGMPRPV